MPPATDFTKQIKDLEERTLGLLALYRGVKAQSDGLLAENAELKEQIRRQGVEIKTLRKKGEKNEGALLSGQKMTKLVNSIKADATDTAGLKEEINQYIQEINRCIIHLSQ